jgi:hypothetical protein
MSSGRCSKIEVPLASFASAQAWKQLQVDIGVLPASQIWDIDMQTNGYASSLGTRSSGQIVLNK